MIGFVNHNNAFCIVVIGLNEEYLMIRVKLSNSFNKAGPFGHECVHEVLQTLQLFNVGFLVYPGNGLECDSHEERSCISGNL